MAETVLSFVLNKLSIFLIEKRRLLGGLRQEVQFIRDELVHMRAFLKVAEGKEEDDPRLREWIKQVREAAYDTEDVLDEFVYRFARHRPTGFYDSVRRIFNSIKNLPARHQVASEIQSIKSRIKYISERHQRYQSEYGITALAVNNHAWRYSRDDALLVEEAQLVGIDKPKQQLISQLLEGDSQLKVISVVGMGGLGKTTLVKKVHEDVDVREHFQIFAWITVSQSCDFQELLKNLIRQLCAETKTPVPQLIGSMASDELKRFVKDFLQQQGRYAIVFDDVWDLHFWDAIKFALPDNNCGNRVILTTRIADVASASCIGSRGYIYNMEPLSFEESWTLFCNRIFENSDCPTYLRNVAESIVGKCEGLPLAIVAISGLLASKDSKDVSREDEWQKVRRSLGGELEEGTGRLDRVKKILCLSYDDLPSHLKTCLLYISIFPEDYIIVCRLLIQLWIVERLVEWREGMTTEEVAWDNLKELCNRSLIQVMKFYEGRPDYCLIHDLLREIILSKSKEQNMVTIATGQHTIWPEKVRRLVLNNFFHSTQETHRFNHLRSLITFGSMESLTKTLLSELLSVKLLKVLYFKGARLEEIPNEIFNLFHLKYLNLSNTMVKTIPKFIGKLQNLEYLNLGETSVRDLPMEILKLPKLRYLLVYEQVESLDYAYGVYGFKAPSKMGGLLALHTLSTIDASNNDETKIVEEIGKLTQLRRLAITNLRREDGKELCSSLEKLTNLENLAVSSIEKEEVIDLSDHYLSSSTTSSIQCLRLLRLRGRLEKIPQWITYLHGLARLDLIWSGLRDDPLETLQHLPNLVELYLGGAYQGEGLCFKTGCFLKLKDIYLGKMEGLRWVRVEEGTMPHLQQLFMQQLPLLEELPLGIQHLNKLQMLELVDLSSQLIEKLQNQDEESEDYKQIAYISQVVIFSQTGGRWRRHQLQKNRKHKPTQNLHEPLVAEFSPSPFYCFTSDFVMQRLRKNVPFDQCNLGQLHHRN